MKKAPWGFMLSLDCAGCHPHLIRSRNNIIAFTNKLVKEIDMKAYGKPQVVMFGEGNKKGFTLVQLIETSNITAHFCEETNDMYFDLFSCKPYNIEKAIRVVNDYFSPVSVKPNYFERNARELE
jgi:S-adenosylmethionine decarboxylase